jgi:hypothetical protein
MIDGNADENFTMIGLHSGTRIGSREMMASQWDGLRILVTRTIIDFTVRVVSVELNQMQKVCRISVREIWGWWWAMLSGPLGT